MARVPLSYGTSAMCYLVVFSVCSIIAGVPLSYGLIKMKSCLYCRVSGHLLFVFFVLRIREVGVGLRLGTLLSSHLTPLV